MLLNSYRGQGLFNKPCLAKHSISMESVKLSMDALELKPESIYFRICLKKMSLDTLSSNQTTYSRDAFSSSNEAESADILSDLEAIQ